MSAYMTTLSDAELTEIVAECRRSIRSGGDEDVERAQIAAVEAESARRTAVAICAEYEATYGTVGIDLRTIVDCAIRDSRGLVTVDDIRAIVIDAPADAEDA